MKKERCNKEIVEEKLTKKLKAKRKDWINSPIILFGVSEISQFCYSFFQKEGAAVVAILDNDPLRKNTKLYDLPIIKPEEIYDYNWKNPYVVIAGGYHEEKKKQLLKCGISKDRILVFYIKLNIFRDLADIIEAQKFLDGFYNKGIDTIYLCPYPGTGDAYLTGMYLYKKINSDNTSHDSYVILTYGKALKKIMEGFYSYNNIQLISKVQCEKLKKYIRYVGRYDSRIKYIMYWGLPFQNTYRIENHKGISFRTLFKESVFGNEYIEPLKFDIDNENITLKLEELGIIKNKTVILAPYANSFKEELDKKWWDELAEKLISLGYKVFTNSSGDKEAVIKNTSRLFLDYKEMYLALEYAGTIIGMRSGLFDLLGTASAKKIIIYQEFITKERMNFFSLKNMGLCEDAIEMKLDNSVNGRNLLMNKIIDYM